MRPFTVMLGTSAAGELEALAPHGRAAVWARLMGLAWNAGAADRLVALGSLQHVIACEVLGSRRVVLVYAIRPGRELERMLLGAELQRRLRNLGIRRALHGRR